MQNMKTRKKMISIPQNYSNNPLTIVRFKTLVEFMNKLELDLQYPNCEGKEDSKRILAQAENKLITMGFL